METNVIQNSATNLKVKKAIAIAGQVLLIVLLALSMCIFCMDDWFFLLPFLLIGGVPIFFNIYRSIAKLHTSEILSWKETLVDLFLPAFLGFVYFETILAYDTSDKYFDYIPQILGGANYSGAIWVEIALAATFLCTFYCIFATPIVKNWKGIVLIIIFASLTSLIYQCFMKELNFSQFSDIYAVIPEEYYVKALPNVLHWIICKTILMCITVPCIIYLHYKEIKQEKEETNLKVKKGITIVGQVSWALVWGTLICQLASWTNDYIDVIVLVLLLGLPIFFNIYRNIHTLCKSTSLSLGETIGYFLLPQYCIILLIILLMRGQFGADWGGYMSCAEYFFYIRNDSIFYSLCDISFYSILVCLFSIPLVKCKKGVFLFLAIQAIMGIIYLLLVAKPFDMMISPMSSDMDMLLDGVDELDNLPIPEFCAKYLPNVKWWIICKTILMCIAIPSIIYLHYKEIKQEREAKQIKETATMTTSLESAQQ